MRRLLSNLSAIAVLALPAAAQIEVGALVPELPAAVWLTEPPAKSLAELRGSVVALWLFDTDDHTQQSTLAVVRRAHSLYARDGLVILGLTNDKSKDVEKWAEGLDIPCPLGASCDAAKAYGSDASWAFLFLLDHEGRVLWNGFPEDSAWLVPLPSALKLAERARDGWDPGERPAALAAAVEHCRFRRFGQAWKAAEKVARGLEAGSPDHAAAEAFLADMDAEATRRESVAETYAAAGCYFQAYGFVERQAEMFKASQPGDRFKEKLKTWRLDRQVKKMRDLDERRLEAVELVYAGGNPGKGIQALKALLDEAGDLPIAATIAEDLDRALNR
ncbi:MAG TPA: hypothetical protein VGC54_05030 [Planctomycetota bacterium]